MTETSRLTIAFVSTTRDSPGARTPGGGKRLFPGDAFLAALHRHGVATTSITMTTRMFSIPWSQTRGYRATRGIPVSGRFLVHLMRSQASVFFCCEYGVETLLTTIVARLRKMPVVVFQEHVGRAGAPLSFVDVCYRRLVGRLASAFVSNTPGARDEIVDTLGVHAARVHLLMILVPPERSELRTAPIDLPTPRARPMFLFVGQLIRRKNVETLVLAAQRLSDEGRSFEVWIAGEGAEEDRLRAMVAEGKLETLVHFVGAIPYGGVGFAYEACDVLVMPSYADLLSMAVFEGARFGRALICSAGVGSVGVVAHADVNALVFDPAQPSELADSMRKFIVEPNLVAEMGHRSEQIMDEHTPDKAARALKEALERIVAPAGRPR
jgi:glycosyltransferase involved in cell wall biosynthesis